VTGFALSYSPLNTILAVFRFQPKSCATFHVIHTSNLPVFEDGASIFHVNTGLFVDEKLVIVIPAGDLDIPADVNPLIISLNTHVTIYATHHFIQAGAFVVSDVTTGFTPSLKK
jgi:hypothetical protein